MLEESPNSVGREAHSPSFLRAGPAGFLGPTDTNPPWIPPSAAAGCQPATSPSALAPGGATPLPRGSGSPNSLLQAHLTLSDLASVYPEPLSWFLGLILAGEERFHTRREAEQKEIARPKCSTLAKMVSKYWTLKIIWLACGVVRKGRSFYLPAGIWSL